MWVIFGWFVCLTTFPICRATLSNNISAWNQCRTLNSSFHCSFRGLSGPQFQFGFYLWNLIWITCLTQLARWRPSMRMCPILTSTTSQGAIFIISPILHNLTSITFQGAILCGHNFPIPLLHHPDVLPAEVRATRWCREAGSSTPSQTTREKPLINLEVTKLINLEVTKMGD